VTCGLPEHYPELFPLRPWPGLRLLVLERLPRPPLVLRRYACSCFWVLVRLRSWRPRLFGSSGIECSPAEKRAGTRQATCRGVPSLSKRCVPGRSAATVPVRRAIRTTGASPIPATTFTFQPGAKPSVAFALLVDALRHRS
jgi:hypothetical protein